MRMPCIHPTTTSRWAALAASTLLLIGAACSPPPPPPLRLNAVLLRESFTTPTSWDTYANASQGADFRITGGAYRATLAQEGILAVLNATGHDDAVIEVETTQASTYRDNAYGVMCRADPADNGDGYYFLISGDGQFTIRRGAGGQITALIPWQASSAIQQNQAINRVRVACIGSQLLLFVNDEWVAEVADPLYKRGVAGLVVGTTAGGSADVLFDDLTIWSAALP